MGGSKGGDQTIGYKYYLGIDFAWCHAPIDRCTALFYDNRQIYRGCFEEGFIEIDEPELFGEFEGGIAGFVDIETGAEDQTANTYTVSQTGSDTPAYRGVTRTVFRGRSEDGSSRSHYMGNNPYLKKITGEFQRIYKRIRDGAVVDQWQKSIAGVPLIDPDPSGLGFQLEADATDQTIFINVDLSSSSNGFAGDNGNITGNGLGIDSMKQAIINSLIDIRDNFNWNTEPTTDFLGNESSGTSGLDIGIGYTRFTNGAKNNSSNNPNNVDPYFAPLQPGVDTSGLWGVDNSAYDLPKRGWMMKESATRADIDDLIAFVNDFVVVPDTVGNNSTGPETRQLMQQMYDNLNEAFATVTSNNIRGHIVYSGMVTDEGYNTAQSIGADIEALLLATAGTGEHPIKSVYGPDLAQFNVGGSLTNGSTIGDGSGSAAVVAALGSPIGAVGDRWDFDRDSGWYLIADQASSPWDGNPMKQQTANSNPYDPGDRILVDNPAGGSTTADPLTGPGPDDKLWIWGPYKDGGIYIGRFDVVEHWGRDVTGETQLTLGTEGRVYSPFHDVEKFTVDLNGVTNTGVTTTDNNGTPGMFLENICGNYVEMNPAHIIRECLTDQQWGLGLAESEIDETSFAAAAQTLYDEFFGVSMAWTRETPIEDFINVVLNHIDAVLYVDRTDGLWHLVLIRDDYDPSSLDEYTDADVVSWENINIKSPAELTNSVTIKYNSRELDGEASLTVNNLAQIQKLGKTIHTTVNYPGIWQDTLANRVAQRDLITLSTSLIAGEIELTRKAYALSPGDVFKLTSSRYNLSGEVMRVVEVNVGDGRQNSVRVKFTQDKYNFDYSESTDLVNPPSSGWEDPNSAEPDTVDTRLVTEEPYYLFVQRVGEVEAENRETNEQTLGYGFISAHKPTTGSVYARTYYDDGSGYKFGRQVSYGPEAKVATANDLWEQADLTTLTLNDFKFYEDVEAGDLIQINDEIMRVDSVDSTTQLTVSRGALDTVPAYHVETSPVFFLNDSNGRILGDYVSSDTIDVKLLDSTNSGLLDNALAPVDTITFDSRITKPYPVGQFQLDGSYRGVWDISTGNTIEATWVHRDRTQQNTNDAPVHTDASVGPETDNNYTISAVAYDYNGDEITSIGDLFSVDKNQNTSHTITPSDNTPESEGTAPWSAVGIRVKTTREEATSEEYDNWQTPEVIAFTQAEPNDLYLYSAAWVDVNQLSTVYEENDQVTNVSADGDPIGAMDNVKDDF